jgi:DNA-binding XRE family transcriptional regulator
MKDEDIQKFRDAIKLERFRNKIDQIEMAQLLNISKPTYIELEKHPYKITLDKMLKMSYILNWNIFDYINNEILPNTTKNN